jgi:hypothetical protein
MIVNINLPHEKMLAAFHAHRGPWRHVRYILFDPRICMIGKAAASHVHSLAPRHCPRCWAAFKDTEWKTGTAIVTFLNPRSGVYCPSV